MGLEESKHKTESRHETRKASVGQGVFAKSGQMPQKAMTHGGTSKHHEGGFLDTFKGQMLHNTLHGNCISKDGIHTHHIASPATHQVHHENNQNAYV